MAIMTLSTLLLSLLALAATAKAAALLPEAISPSPATNDPEEILAARPGVPSSRKEDWWSLSKLIDTKTRALAYADSVRECDQLPLSRRQRELCKSSRAGEGAALVTVAARASLAATRECQRHFAEDRWQCQHFSTGPLFGRSIKHRGSREAAFIHSIMAASFSHEATVACREKKLAGCDCKRPGTLRPMVDEVDEVASQAVAYSLEEGKGFNKSQLQFEWGTDCFDDTAFGPRKAKQFIDDSAAYVRRRARQLMNQHNHRVGMKLAEQTQTKCKCLGVTASCNVQVCWREVRNFKVISRELKEKYDKAVRMRLVMVPNDASSDATALEKSSENDARLVKQGRVQRKDMKWYLTPVDPQQPYPKVDELIYIDESPDYCMANETMGIVGTKGRSCHNDDDNSPGSCNNLCCGRGHRTVQRTIRTSCNCQFVYCCRVKCQTCEHTVTEHFCN